MILCSLDCAFLKYLTFFLLCHQKYEILLAMKQKIFFDLADVMFDCFRDVKDVRMSSFYLTYLKCNVSIDETKNNL
jgi:hypothetical protein